MNKQLTQLVSPIVLVLGIAVSSLSIADTVIGTHLSELPIAVIVNPDNTNTLDQKAIAKLFLGKKKSFPDGSKATPIDQKTGSASKGVFVKAVLKKSNKQFKAYWAKQVFTGKGTPPKELGSDTAVKEYVANNVGAIGYIDAVQVDDSVKVVLTP